MDIRSTKSYKIYSSDRKTLEEVRYEQKKNVPAPGTYNPDPLKLKIMGPIKSTSEKGQFIMDAQYKGMVSLAPGHYKANYT